MNAEKRLDIGAGSEPRPGYTWVDAYYVGPEYINAFCWDIPFEDESITEIYSSHLLEHLQKRDIDRTLAEWFRVLEQGGGLEIEVPDLKYCVEEWLRVGGDGWEMDMIFGNQDDEGQFHKTGFSETILTEKVQFAGFNVIKVEEVQSHNQKCLHLIAQKPFSV